MAKIVSIPNPDKDAENLDHSYIAGRRVNGIATLDKSWVVSLKTKHPLTV